MSAARCVFLPRSRAGRSARSLALLLAAGVIPSASYADSYTSDAPSNGQSTTPDDVLTVKSRAVAEDLPVGVRAGSFLLSPGMEVLSTYDDNILRTSQNKISDVITDVKPAFAVQSDWERHAMFLGAEGDLGYFRNTPSENYRDYGLLASGQYDFAQDTYLIAAVSQARRHEDLGSVTDPNGSAPIEYTATREQLQFTRALGQVHLDVTGQNEHVSLADLTSATGLNDEDFLTRNDRNLGTTITYQYMPGNDLFASAAYDTTDYTLPAGGLSLNAHGADFRAGLDFDGGSALTGSVYGGYIFRTYEAGNPDTRDPFAGGKFNWQITSGMLFSGVLDKTFNETTVAGAAGAIHTTRKLTLRQAFTDRVTADVSGGFDNDEFVGGDSAVDRNTRIYYGGVGANYKLSENCGLRAEYDYEERRSPLPSDVYNDNRVSLSLVYML